MRDLLDSYLHVEMNLQALVTAGDVLAVAKYRRQGQVLFPRGEALLVELDGQVNMNITMNMNMAPPPPKLPALDSMTSEITSTVVKTEPDAAAIVVVV
jgi:hypothetical protein